MRVLITGGYGFIGSFVADRFYREGYKVHIIDNLSTGSKENVQIPHTFYNINTQDQNCEEIFRSGKFEIVVHLAAQTDIEASGPDKEAEGNVLGLVNMLTLAQKYGVKKFIYASSAAVYGQSTKVPSSEWDECNPQTPFAINKYLGEFYCNHWNDRYSMQTICFRISHVYGPMQKPNGESGVIASFMQRIREGKKLVVYGDGEQTRDFIYVEDVADAIYRSSQTDLTGVYNLSTNTETSIHQLIQYLERIAPVKGVEYRKAKENDIRRSNLNFSKLNREMDWVPLYTLEEGLDKTYQWFSKKPITRKSKNKKVEPKLKLPHLRKAKPYIENIIIFLIVVLLSVSKIRFLENLLMDYYVIYIWIIGIVYGLRQSLIAVGLSVLWSFTSKIIEGREAISLLFDSEFLFVISMYLFIGLLLGYTTDNRKQGQQLLKSELNKVKQDYDFLYEMYQEMCSVKEELQAQILHNRDGVGRIHSLIRELDHHEPLAVMHSAVHIVEEIMGSGHVSIYAVNNEAEVHLLVHSSKQNDQENATYPFSLDSKLWQTIKNREIFINRELDMNLPSMAAPILYCSHVVGVITIENLGFESFTIYHENLLRISTDLISRSIQRAIEHVELTKDDRYFNGTRLLTEKAMEVILDLKRRAKKEHRLTYELFVVDHPQLSNQQIYELVQRFIRQTDTIGVLHGKVIALLTNPQPIEIEMIAKQMKQFGISFVKVDDNAQIQVQVGKYAYA